MDSKTEKTKSCSNCNCKSNYLYFLPRLVIASLLIFVFYIALSSTYYTFLFGEMWFTSLINAPTEMAVLGPSTVIWMTIGNLTGSFITANIFFIYLKRIAISRADKECSVHWCMVIPLIVLLSGFYFMSSAMNIVFDVYTLTHLLIETGYLFVGLTFSGFIVTKLLKSKFK